MFTTHIKIAFRNLFRNRTSSVINISGLAVGMGVAMLTGLWIYDELSFNKYHANYDRVAQVMVTGNDAKDGPYINNSLQYPLATELRTNYKTYFKDIVRASWVKDYILGVGEKKISRTGQFMDQGAPEMLTLKMLEGSYSGLKDQYSIMLSASTAKALFGNARAIDQMISLNNKTTLKVTAVYEDLPLNSQFKNIQFLSSWDLWVMENEWIRQRALDDWHNHFLKVYAVLPSASQFGAVNDAIKNIEYQHIKDKEGFEEAVASKPKVFLHPMSRWHLFPFQDGITDRAPVRMVRIIATIGLFVLLLGCINFINLSTARSERRAREVGIRKAIGSFRRQLIHQFFIESFLVVLLAFGIACFLVAACLPWFNSLCAKEMNFGTTNVYFWLICAGFVLLTGFLAGSYPAIYLSSFKPIKVLKGSFHVGRFASMPRKALVVLQFTVSVALIISTIAIYRQVQYAKARPVGYTREGLITVQMTSGDYYGKYDLLKTALLNTGVVSAFSESMGKVTEVVSGNNGFDWKGRDPRKEESFGTLAVTHEHGKTVGWQFTAGRDFSRDFASDSSGVVINESAARYIGLAQPVGETITWNWQNKNTPVAYKIIGVIEDMVMSSPYEPIEPTLFFVKPLNGGVNWMNIKAKPGVSMEKTLAAIEAVFKKIVPAAPFDYRFVEDDYAQKFASEERIGKLSAFFASLAIFISCLGIFGLASFMAEQRKKEIGIRKVLGASVLGLWQLLTTEFVMLVVISLIIASPIGYYFTYNWLQDFQYRADLSWWIFAASGISALFVTIMTVSYQSIKAALLNPVKSLRTE